MLFIYRSVFKDKIITGKVEAGSQGEVIEYLRANGYFPIDIHQETQTDSFLSGKWMNSISETDIVHFTRELSIMLNAGLTLTSSLEVIASQTNKKPLKNLIESIDKEIKSGKSFSDVLKNYPDSFPRLYVALIHAGEVSGKLSEILSRLADDLEKRHEFTKKIQGAMVYPVIVIVGMFVVVFVMMVYVVPSLTSLYKDFNIELPQSTQILIATSGFLSKFSVLIIAGVIGGVIAMRQYMQTYVGRLTKDTLLLQLPIINKVVTYSTLTVSSRTLATVIASGVLMLESLSIVIETTGNVVYQKAFVRVKDAVEKGSPIGIAMAKEHVFPPILVQMVTVGETTGKLDDILFRVAHYFEVESEAAVKAMTTLIEPAILVVLGAVVTFIVLSIITPIYSLTSGIGV